RETEVSRPASELAVQHVDVLGVGERPGRLPYLVQRDLHRGQLRAAKARSIAARPGGVKRAIKRRRSSPAPAPPPSPPPAPGPPPTSSSTRRGGGNGSGSRGRLIVTRRQRRISMAGYPL